MMPFNLVLALDCSSSMTEPAGSVSKMECVRRAVPDFVRLLPSTTSVGIVTFASDAHVALPLTPLRDMRGRLAMALSTLRPNGLTAMSAGLEVGIRELTKRPRHFPRRMVLLSDGHPSNGVESLDLPIARAKREGVRIDPIGFGMGAQLCAPLLQAIATKTGGSYSFAGELNSLFAALRRAV